MSDPAGQLKEWTGEARLPELIQHHYGIRLKEVRPVGGVLRLDSDQGVFALKRVPVREELRWKLIRELADYLPQSGEGSLTGPIRTQRGGVTVAGHHHRYVLLPWIPGEIRDLREGGGWEATARALAGFHVSTKGFSPSRSAASGWVHTGHWRRIWRDLTRQVNMFKLAANLSGEPAPVDQLWLRQCAYAEGMLETADRYFERLGGDRTVVATRKGGEVCHCNIHRRNLIWDPEGKVRLIDWNRAVLDVRSRDLARFILYSYGRTGSCEPTTAILKAYQETAPLEEVEYALIYAQLLFPHRILRSLQRIYQEQKIPPHLAKGHLSSVMTTEDRKEGLLREFPRLIRRDFNVSIPRVDWLDRGRAVQGE
ncbi:phosphotransferase [Kroppenstedtia eburnea]|uniref:Spore coat protein, CotS family n=1 Tax=Kroppenstedtia eburnea TaxID=714067 RepID=A0A1N7LHK7_9BACL|nr:phosphotransferase [Kroppenstedtia eburnea]QKI81337.1 phosphotransferase [Kroppenstedtia eburnea]SIS73284.1 spore coat protein, CotS family [Kroppenstedtia eburnea]